MSRDSRQSQLSKRLSHESLVCSFHRRLRSFFLFNPTLHYVIIISINLAGELGN